MTICSTVRTSPFLFLNRRKISTGNFYSSVRAPAVFCASSKFAIPRSKNLANSISSFTSTTYKKKVTAVPFNLDEAQQTSSSSSVKDPLNTIWEYMKAMKIIHVVMVTLSLLGIRMMYGHQSALAFSGGAMGGYSFSSSSDSSSHSWSGSSTSSSKTSSSKTSSNSRVPSDDKVSVEDAAAMVLILLIIILFVYFIIRWEEHMDRVTIIKLQVGLLVNEQSLQKDLNNTAKTTDSSTEAGWEHMMKETVNSLLRHEKYWISGSSSLEVFYNNKIAEKYFKKLSSKERKKFSEETLVNLDDMEKESIPNKIVNDQFNDTYMVVTIVMAANIRTYEPEIPTIVHSEDVKKALKELRRISKISKIEGLHVLWAPQREKEVLSLKEFRENYPCLKAFQSVPAQVLGD